MIVPDDRVHIPGYAFKHMLQILDGRMPDYNRLFSLIPFIKLAPDPDQVFFLLLIQRNTRLYPCMTEIKIPHAVI